MSDSSVPVIDVDVNPLGALVQLAEVDPYAREAVKRVALMALAHRAITDLVYEIPALDGVGSSLDPRTRRTLDCGRVLTIIEALPSDIKEAIRRPLAELRTLARSHNAQLFQWYQTVAELRDAFALMSVRSEYPLVMKLFTEVMAAAKASEDSGNPFPLSTMMQEQGLDWPYDPVADDPVADELPSGLLDDDVDDGDATDALLDDSVLRERLQALIAMLPQGDDGQSADDQLEPLPATPVRVERQTDTDQPGPARLVDEAPAARCRRTIQRYQWAVGALCAAAVVILVVAGLMTQAAQERAHAAAKRADVRIAEVESEAKRAVEKAQARLDAPVAVKVRTIGHSERAWKLTLPSTILVGDSIVEIAVPDEAAQ